MKHIYKGSTLKIKPINYEAGGNILFYTVNPSFGTMINEVDSEGFVNLEWSDLENMGRGVLNYKVNNSSTGKDYSCTTLYFIDTDSEVGDIENLGNVSDKLKKNVTDKVQKELEQGLTNLTEKIELAITHMPYIGEDYYIYEWDNETQNYNKTTKYLKGEKGDEGDIGEDGEKGEDGRLRLVNHGTSDTTFALTPNVMHVWGMVDQLTLTLDTSQEEDGFLAEYAFQFTCPATIDTTLSLPIHIKWYNNFVVTPKAGKTYQGSIINNIIMMGGV